jgi:hypothetical protein
VKECVIIAQDEEQNKRVVVETLARVAMILNILLAIILDCAIDVMAVENGNNEHK